MSEPQSQRYYASTEYLLPADELETRRLNRQHEVIVKAFEDRLSLAPLSLKNGDLVLESAAGSGIWALHFFESNSAKGITVEIECTDISPKQFPAVYPPQIHFSVNSVTDLPPEWSNRFAFIHQRLLVAALNDARWRSAIKEMFRVAQPGGWVELVELEIETLRWGVGPNSKRLCKLIENLKTGRGVIGDLSTYLPPLLKDAGFVDVECVTRHVLIGGELSGDGKQKEGYRSEDWQNLWRGMKGPIVEGGGGYGIVKNAEEYEELLENSALEWKSSNEANTSLYTILARKPL